MGKRYSVLSHYMKLINIVTYHFPRFSKLDTPQGGTRTHWTLVPQQQKCC